MTFVAVTALAPRSATAQAEADPRQACLQAHEQAQVKRMDSDLLTATKFLRHCSEAICPAFIRGDCVRWLEEVHSAIPTVTLVASSEDGDESDVRVFVDGRLVTEKLDGRAIELNPGVYEFRFEREPAKPIVKQVVLREGEKNRVVSAEFDLRPDPAPVVAPPAPTAPAPTAPAPVAPVTEDYRPVPPLTFILGGVAVAGAATAAILGVSARSSRDDAVASCAPLCSDSEVGSIRAKAIGSDFSAGIALVAAAGAAYFYVERPTRQREVPARRIALGPLQGGAFIGVEGDFE